MTYFPPREKTKRRKQNPSRWRAARQGSGGSERRAQRERKKKKQCCSFTSSFLFPLFFLLSLQLIFICSAHFKKNTQISELLLVLKFFFSLLRARCVFCERPEKYGSCRKPFGVLKMKRKKRKTQREIIRANVSPKLLLIPRRRPKKYTLVVRCAVHGQTARACNFLANAFAYHRYVHNINLHECSLYF